MAAIKSTKTDEQRIEEIVAALKANRVNPAVKKSSLTEFLTDKAADSARNLSRIAAGFAASAENAKHAFEQERERQTYRTAQHLLELARQ